MRSLQLVFRDAAVEMVTALAVGNLEKVAAMLSVMVACARLSPVAAPGFEQLVEGAERELRGYLERGEACL